MRTDPVLKKPQGDQYAEFITKILKPHIDSTFRTLKNREKTGIAGSSFGCIISLFTGIRYQNVFSRVGVFSPSTWAMSQFNSFLEETGHKYKTRFFLYAGGMEANDPEWNKQYIEDIRDLSQSLKKEGFNDENIKITIDPEASHNEKYWSKHFPECFLWLFED